MGFFSFIIQKVAGAFQGAVVAVGGSFEARSMRKEAFADRKRFCEAINAIKFGEVDKGMRVINEMAREDYPLAQKFLFEAVKAQQEYERNNQLALEDADPLPRRKARGHKKHRKHRRQSDWSSDSDDYSTSSDDDDDGYYYPRTNCHFRR